MLNVYARPPESPDDCIFAQTTACFSSISSVGSRRASSAEILTARTAAALHQRVSRRSAGTGCAEAYRWAASFMRLFALGRRSPGSVLPSSRPGFRARRRRRRRASGPVRIPSVPSCRALSSPSLRRSFLQTLDDAGVANDQTDLAAPVQLQRAQALTADECRIAVADDGAHVHPHRGHLLRRRSHRRASPPCR